MELTKKYLGTRMQELVADKRAHVAELEALEQKRIAHEAQINAIMGAMQELEACLRALDLLEPEGD